MTFEEWLGSYLLDNRYADTAPKELMAAMAYNAATVAQRAPQPCGHPTACLHECWNTVDEVYEDYCLWCVDIHKARREEREVCRLRMLEREREVQACKDDFREGALADGEITSYVNTGVTILGFWNKCLEGDELAAVRGACQKDESVLSRAFDLWVQGRDEEAKTLIPEKDHVLLDGLIMWEGITREGAATENPGEQCHAVICHGPGHQSQTECYLTGPHEIHEARFGWADQLARWKGDKVYSGYFDESPADPRDATDDEYDHTREKSTKPVLYEGSFKDGVAAERERLRIDLAVWYLRHALSLMGKEKSMSPVGGGDSRVCLSSDEWYSLRLSLEMALSTIGEVTDE